MQRKLFFIILGIFFIFLLYSFRGVYSQKFDYKYMRDLYDHSQWTLAQTVRIVSDDQVYQVAGYDAVTTGELYRTAPEVPPLGKYLIGASITAFKNGQIMSFVLYVFSVFVFYILASLILKDTKLAMIATLIFSTEPLIFSQAALSMMDLPLMISLLLHTLFMLLLLKNNKETFSLFKKIILVLGAGFSLGAFLAIKIGFFAIIIIITDAIILMKNRKLPYLLFIILGAFVFYSFTYLPFFMQGHTFIEFLKAQKWMISFYLISKVKALVGMPFASLVFGYYKNWSEGSQFSRFSEWTILWPLYLTTIFIMVKATIRKWRYINDGYLYLLFICVGFIGLFMILPFWVRYFVIVIPFAIIVFTLVISRFDKRILLVIFVLYGLQVGIFLYQPLQENYLNRFAQVWENGAYQDLYGSLNNSFQETVSRERFWRSMQKFERDLMVTEKKVVILRMDPPWKYPQEVKIIIEYHTPVSVYTDSIRSQFIKEGGVWKMKWNYNAGNVTASLQNGSFGKLMTEDGDLISDGQLRPYYSVISSQIKDESTMQRQLLFLTGQKKYEVELNYKANNQPDWPAGIGFLKNNLSIASAEALMLDPGINVDMKETRVYNLAVFTNPKLFQIIEKKQSLLLPILNPKFGGDIKITIDNRIKYRIVKEPENGDNMVLKGIWSL